MVGQWLVCRCIITSAQGVTYTSARISSAAGDPSVGSGINELTVDSVTTVPRD